MKKSIDEIARIDGRYSAEMIKFVYEGLSYTIDKYRQEAGHINGEMLCEGLKDLARQRWGRLAKLVLEQGGVKSSRDIGEIVYLMIRHNWMSAQSSDSIEDFEGVYEFDVVFKGEFEF